MNGKGEEKRKYFVPAERNTRKSQNRKETLLKKYLADDIDSQSTKIQRSRNSAIDNY
jgi:hypothetical protein